MVIPATRDGKDNPAVFLFPWGRAPYQTVQVPRGDRLGLSLGSYAAIIYDSSLFSSPAAHCALVFG
jgi:hypothetical protein